VGTISFKFCTIDSDFLKLTSNTFYCPNITIHDIILSLLVHKEKVYVLFTM